jgi:hypothetical protein
LHIGFDKRADGARTLRHFGVPDVKNIMDSIFGARIR